MHREGCAAVAKYQPYTEVKHGTMHENLRFRWFDYYQFSTVSYRMQSAQTIANWQ